MRDWTKPAIERMARFRPERSTWLLAVLAALGSVLILTREATYGVGLHWDSINYIGVARNLLAGDGFLHHSGAIYVLAPPLLALPGIFGVEPANVAGWLNASLYGFTVVVASLWLQRHIRSCLLVMGAGVTLALSFPLQFVAWRTWSDSLFILLTVLSLFSCIRFLDSDRRSTLLLAAAFTALACLTRYIGIAVVTSIVFCCCPGQTLRSERRCRISAYTPSSRSFLSVYGCCATTW